MEEVLELGNDLEVGHEVVPEVAHLTNQVLQLNLEAIHRTRASMLLKLNVRQENVVLVTGAILDDHKLLRHQMRIIIHQKLKLVANLDPRLMKEHLLGVVVLALNIVTPMVLRKVAVNFYVLLRSQRLSTFRRVVEPRIDVSVLVDGEGLRKSRHGLPELQARLESNHGL